ncbi:MAG: low molecular weight phosphotyrosine protein phosphatase [Oscillospiraceae bacterium]|nr:low molecular weight phosphotyrosine protein phosphatase [Oscillospiraceae bacterium]
MIKVMFVCHGNICRSPMAEMILKEMVRQRGIADQFVIASSATSTEEIWGDRGNPIYPPALDALKRHGIPVEPHYAVQLKKSDYAAYDHILCMDSLNLRNIGRMLGADRDGKIRKLLDFTDAPRDVSDPWFTGNFERAYADITEGCEALLAHLERSGKI